MHPRLLIAPAMLAALTACTTTQAPAEPVGEASRPGGTCEADSAQQYVGKQASAAVGNSIIAATGAEIFQWVPPDTAVTMDYRPNRVRVSYDRTMTISSILCG